MLRHYNIGGDLISRIYIPMAEDFLVPSNPCGPDSQKTAFYEWRNESLLDAQPAVYLILEFSVSHRVRNKFLRLKMIFQF